MQHGFESLTEAHRALDTKLVAERTRVEGLGDLTTELKRSAEQLITDAKNADRRFERAQEQISTAKQAHEDAMATLRAKCAAEREAIAQKRGDETQRAEMLQQCAAVLDIDITKVTAQHTAECTAHNTTRSALQQAEQALDASRQACQSQVIAVAQRDGQLATVEAARQQDKHHFTGLIAEKDRRVAEQAASIRDVTAVLKRAQSPRRKSS